MVLWLSGYIVEFKLSKWSRVQFPIMSFINQMVVTWSLQSALKKKKKEKKKLFLTASSNIILLEIIHALVFLTFYVVPCKLLHVLQNTHFWQYFVSLRSLVFASIQLPGFQSLQLLYYYIWLCICIYVKGCFADASVHIPGFRSSAKDGPNQQHTGKDLPQGYQPSHRQLAGEFI